MDFTLSLRYYWGCCFVCRKIDSSLKRCSRCRCLYYCSVEHQKLDWKRHREFCLQVACLLRLTVARDLFEDSCEYADSGSKWLDFRFQLARLLEVAMSRHLDKWERDVVMFPRVCRLCFRVNLPDMVDCAGCMCVTYCSVEHQQCDAKEHLQWCRELHVSMSADNVACSPRLKPLALPSQFNEAFLPVTGDAMTLLKAQLRLDGNAQVDDLQVRLLSDVLTAPLTVLYVADKYGLGNNRVLDECTELCIHVVGANFEEMVRFAKWEYISHRLPALKKLRVVFIGLELDMEEEGMCSDVVPCEECVKRKTCILCEIRKRPYQAYATSDQYTRPDLVCAFNCGFHEFEESPSIDTWKESLPFLVRHCGVPLMFTSYTKVESAKDMARVQRYNSGLVSVLTAEEINPFRSHLPIRDPEWPVSPDVFYKNQFLSVVQRVAAEC